ncbi:MAG: hypothetical protein PVJ30_05195 [Thiohalocapsa sp.]|jgi:hypothetical protein|uniref:hypothetical protein n=1 Tax=Thiohalocapsa sp. TaxID=2497641 RepID=UPI0025DA7651|nr:hypothetical protein [Thiohalocapsa sp.]
MSAIQEHHVSTLAHRIGLRLVQPPTQSGLALYRLVEPSSMQPIYPAGGPDGAPLADLEDWLQFPWE